MAGEISTAIADLPPDLAIMKIERETMMSAAVARPRDMAQIKRDVAESLKEFPGFAAVLIYCKPVGKDASGQEKFARGLSVRAAELLSEAYGFNAVRSDVIEVDEDRVKVHAVFVDYQRNRTWETTDIVSKWYRSKTGQMVRHPEDRFYGVVVKAAQSKAVREVINRSVSPGLKNWLEDEARRITGKLLTEDQVNQIVAKFGDIGVSLEDLERFLGVKRSAGWTLQHRLDLLGVWNGIEQGEETVASVFRPDEPKVKPPAGPTVTEAALEDPEVAEEPERKPEPEASKEPESTADESPAADPAPKSRKRSTKKADPAPAPAGPTPPPAATAKEPEPEVDPEPEPEAEREPSPILHQFLKDLEDAENVQVAGRLLNRLLSEQSKLTEADIEEAKTAFRAKSAELSK